MQDVRYRPAIAEDFAFLATMLGEAAVWRPEKPTLGGLIDASVAQGYAALSLSVNDGNPARRLYESVGFVYVQRHGAWTMIRHAAKAN